MIAMRRSDACGVVLRAIGVSPEKYSCIPKAGCSRNVAATSQLIGEIDWSAKVSREVSEAPADALIHVR
jgi:hypothetical protein